jgi:hypothetical protein
LENESEDKRNMNDEEMCVCELFGTLVLCGEEALQMQPFVLENLERKTLLLVS